MDCQVPPAALLVRPAPVEKDEAGTQELGTADDLEAQTEHGAAVDGVGIRILDEKGGDAGAGAVQTLLVVCSLRVQLIKKFLAAVAAAVL